MPDNQTSQPIEQNPQPTPSQPQPKRFWLPVLIALLVLIVVGGFLLWLAKEAKDTNQEIQDQQTPASQNNHQPADDGLTITNQTYGYSFKRTKDFATENELDAGIAELAYFSKPGWKTADSIALNETTFNGTNFGSGIMTVAVHPQITTEAECNTYDAGSGVKQLTTTQSINNVAFHTGSFTGAAAGTKYNTKLYHTLHNGMCYEINTTVGISNIGNYEPGTIKEVNEDDVWKKFNDVISTFKFIQPVGQNDTSKWKTYQNSFYGIEFMVPEDIVEAESSKLVAGQKDVSARIQNYTTNNDMEILGPGEYYLELGITDTTKTSTDTCDKQVSQAKSVIISGHAAYRGYGFEGGDAGGRRFALCTNNGKYQYFIQVTENSEKGIIANSILDSFKFIK